MGLLLAASDTGDTLLIVSLIIVSILLGIACLYAAIAEFIVWVRYYRYNRIENKSGLTGIEAARKLLDSLGMEDVRVERGNFFALAMWGNSYSPRKKLIRLRWLIANKTSITSIGLATQKVGLAIIDKYGDKKFHSRAKMLPFVYFAPFFFIPFILIGTLLDVVIFKTDGLVSLIATLFAVAFYVVSLIYTIMNVKVEKHANEVALELMEKTDFLDAEEREGIKRVYKAYITQYIADFIVTLLKSIQFLLKLIAKAKFKDK